MAPRSEAGLALMRTNRTWLGAGHLPRPAPWLRPRPRCWVCPRRTWISTTSSSRSPFRHRRTPTTGPTTSGRPTPSSRTTGSTTSTARPWPTASSSVPPTCICQGAALLWHRAKSEEQNDSHELLEKARGARCYTNFASSEDRIFRSASLEVLSPEWFRRTEV